MYHRYNFKYVWGEWFKTFDEIAADPRCEVDKQTFLRRLKIWPVEQAVKKVPDWHPDDIVNWWKYECTEEQLRRRLQQGFPPYLSLSLATKYQDVLRYILDIPFKQYYKVSRQNSGNCNKTFKALGAPVAYNTFKARIRYGWGVKEAALRDFLFLVFGRKYNSRAEVIAANPWVEFNYNHTLEEMIIC
jgi:hypothetical protein